MLDMCQLSNRLTEHKYMGTYIQLAETIRKHSAGAMLDVQRFWEIVLFSWITGNSDMHCKNFSLLEKNGGYVLSPAYDLLAVLLADPDDTDELAMPLMPGGRTNGLTKESFLAAFASSGIPEKIALRLISRMVSHADRWFELIESSFLPDQLKERYKALVRERLAALG
jgi:serine/threonine-protein kinase HipA